MLFLHFARAIGRNYVPTAEWVDLTLPKIFELASGPLSK